MADRDNQSPPDRSGGTMPDASPTAKPVSRAMSSLLWSSPAFSTLALTGALGDGAKEKAKSINSARAIAAVLLLAILGIGWLLHKSGLI